jgi:hypothetical protein
LLIQFQSALKLLFGSSKHEIEEESVNLLSIRLGPTICIGFATALWANRSANWRLSQITSGPSKGSGFATNGPFLFLTVAGLEPGATVKTKPGEKLLVRFEAKSLRQLDRVEIIYRGRVIRSFQQTTARGDLVGTFEFAPSTDGWLAARAFEKPDRTIRFSHTSPVYLDLATATAREVSPGMDRSTDGLVPTLGSIPS